MRRAAFYGVAAGVLVLDQLSKAWAVQALAGAREVPVIPGYLVMNLVFNPGAAFGLFPSGTLMLALLAAVAIVVMVWIERRGSLSIPMAVAVGLQLGGAVGNLIDRLRLGVVIDFLDVRWAGRNVWPVFNIADMAITVGAIMLVTLLLLAERRPSPKAPAPES
jgi:signal peptidase II